jgi:hypothetical protein
MADLNRGVAIANAAPKCAYCYGGGMLSRGRTCHCVLRAVFRICLNQYRYSAENSISLNRCCVMEISRGGKILTGLPHAEYVADFERAADRALDPARRNLFQMHFLDGLQYPACLAKLGLDRGKFFHETYRVEEQVGAECLKAIYPLDQYFGVRRVATVKSAVKVAGGSEIPHFHRPPLMAAA